MDSGCDGSGGWRRGLRAGLLGGGGEIRGFGAGVLGWVGCGFVFGGRGETRCGMIL